MGQIERLQAYYELFNYGHALEILQSGFPDIWAELCSALPKLRIKSDWITEAGGRKTQIAETFDRLLFPLGWKEMRIDGDLIIHQHIRSGRTGADDIEHDFTYEGYIEGHNIDFVKGRVALDLEWNSKDQTFDRDLMAMRTYFDAGIIDVGIIITRSNELNDIFKRLGVIQKYGASTTHIGKLIYRLDSRRQGGCPILAVGIKSAIIER